VGLIAELAENSIAITEARTQKALFGRAGSGRHDGERRWRSRISTV